MIEAREIKNEMPVLSNQSEQFATVDHLDSADTSKLKKDAQGIHHYIPLSWAIACDNGMLKINRTVQEAMKDWSETPLVSAYKDN